MVGCSFLFRPFLSFLTLPLCALDISLSLLLFGNFLCLKLCCFFRLLSFVLPSFLSELLLLSLLFLEAELLFFLSLADVLFLDQTRLFFLGLPPLPLLLL
jgi:hypothetical protein